MAMSDEEILQSIKENVLSIVPDAKVMLFGSRARGDWHDESDWDILVLTKQEVTYQLKNRIYEALHPLCFEILSLISPTIANENDWNNHAGWYSLSLSIKDDLIAI